MTIAVGGWYTWCKLSSLAVVLGFWQVCDHRALDDWCAMRCLKLHFVHVLLVSAVHTHFVVMGLVEYGSVNGVWGSNMASVVPTRAMASLSMSPVDLSMSAIVVWVVMAVFVRVSPCSI